MSQRSDETSPIPHGDIVGGGEEVQEALDHKRGGRLARMDPGHDEHHLDLLVLHLVTVNVDFPPEVDIVRVGDGDQVNRFLKHRQAQGFFEHIIMLSR